MKMPLLTLSRLLGSGTRIGCTKTCETGRSRVLIASAKRHGETP